MLFSKTINSLNVLQEFFMIKVPEIIRADWERIIAGTVDVIPDEELADKLIQSRRSGVPLRIKYGADPSAPDIHLGHTVPIRKLRTFQELGHQIVFIIGDFTARIGDPTGRSETRKRLTTEEVAENARTYLDQIFKILDPDKTEVVYNSSWFDKMSFANVIELGARYTVARMLERDDFKKRMAEERPVFVHEFLYPLAQGWDSVEIRADVELGGTDQRFNFLVAREIQKEVGMVPQCIMTLPLLVGTDGVKKMSKSLGNYIGITEPSREIFGKIMSIPDDLMADYLQLALGYTKQETDRFRSEISSGALHPRDLKARIGRELVALYHNASEANHAEEEFNRMFREKEMPDDIPEMTICISKDFAALADIIVQIQMADSKRKARGLITGGGVRINGESVSSPDYNLNCGEYIINVGKRHYKKVHIQK